jgi:hypothetical protein
LEPQTIIFIEWIFDTNEAIINKVNPHPSTLQTKHNKTP